MGTARSLELWEVFAREAREARQTRGLTVRELAERVRAAGFDGPSAVRISQIEAGGQPDASEDVRQRAANVRLREVVALSLSLGPAPPNLLAPIDEDAAVGVRLGDVTLDAKQCRHWLLGLDERPLDLDPDASRLFYLHSPPRVRRAIKRRVGESEWRGMLEVGADERREIISSGTALAEGDWTKQGEED
jgi:transcriptional regulator with XRE-family HTH domain